MVNELSVILISNTNVDFVWPREVLFTLGSGRDIHPRVVSIDRLRRFCISSSGLCILQ